MSWLDSITNPMGMNLSKLWEIVEDSRAWHAVVHRLQTVGHDSVTEQQEKLHCVCVFFSNELSQLESQVE